MANETSVTRTYRTAIRCGEDFITIEETITLPIGAGDDEIASAVETGLRMYHAQQAAIEQQVASIREQAGAGPAPRIMDPESPASEKQRAYLDHLTQALELPEERVDEYLRERGAAYETLTKGQASSIIDELKAQLDTRREAPSAAQAQPEQAADPASERQLKALENLAREHELDLDGEVRSRFQLRSPEELSSAQAAQLLKELQPAQRRARQESAMLHERRR